MPKTAHLTDLYTVGKEIVVKQGEVEVPVYLRKLSPVDHETAMRRANAKRARTLTLKHLKLDNSDEERDAVLNEVFDTAPTRERLIEFLVEDKVSKVVKAREAEVAAREHWAENDLLQGLKDAWLEEYFVRFSTDPEDQEARDIKEKIDEFNKEVQEFIEGDRRDARKTFEDYDDEKLIKLALDRLIEAKADADWLTEYRRSEVWLGTRKPDNHKEKYFKSREEVDDLSINVLAELINNFMELTVDAIEGKE